MPIYTTPNINRPQRAEEEGATFGQFISATGAEAFSENAFMFFKNSVTDAMVESQSNEIVSMDEANERGKEYGLSFDNHMPADVLEMQIDRAKARQKRGVISGAYQGPFKRTTGFVTGLGASFVDPLELVVNFLPGVGMARVGAKGIGAVRLAQKLERLETANTFATRALKGSIEGLFGASALEPVRLIGASREQIDYDFHDSLVNLFFGTAVGGVLHPAIGKIQDHLNTRLKKQITQEIGAEIEELNARATVAEKFATADHKTKIDSVRGHIAEMESGRTAYAGPDLLGLDKATDEPYSTRGVRREMSMRGPDDIETRATLERIAGRTQEVPNAEYANPARAEAKAVLENPEAVDFTKPESVLADVEAREATLKSDMESIVGANDELLQAVGLERKMTEQGKPEIRLAELDRADIEVKRAQGLPDVLRALSACVEGRIGG